MELRTEPRLPHVEFFPPPPEPGGPSLWLGKLAADRRELVRFWPVVKNMVVQDLKVRVPALDLGFFLDAAQSPLDDGDPVGRFLLPGAGG